MESVLKGGGSQHAHAAKRPCPVCGGLNSRLLFRQSFAQLSGVSFLTGYDVVVCERCGLAFADGVPAQEVFNSYYRELSKYEHAHRDGQESITDRQRFADIAALLKKFIPARRSRVLEIGCATGGLLSALKDEGFTNVHGLDPSPACAETASRLYGISVFTGTVFDMPGNTGVYDVVIAVGVLEHVEAARQALRRIGDILAPGGLVYAEVPDATRLTGRPDAPYQEFSIEHINFFSPVSLTNLLWSSGFVPVACDRVVRMQNENLTYPAVFGVYRKSQTSEPGLTLDQETAPALTRYIQESEMQDLRVRAAIERGARGRPIIVWGTGTHTQRLLSVRAFANVQITAFVDSNPKYQHHELCGVPVLGPAEILHRKEPVLISSCGFQREIREQIQQTLGMHNELILLYDE
jgi:SAM-dependent methyltransferase